MLKSSQLIAEVAEAIAPVDPSLISIAQLHIDNLTKPVGSLGQLEQIAARIFAIRKGRMDPAFHKSVYVFAADHGVAGAGVSAYPSEVTAQMVRNFLAGGAAINVLARLHGADVHVVDAGVNADLSDCSGLLHRKVRHGSRNMLREAAMSDAECEQALQAGVGLAEAASLGGNALLAVGEMGIGNTTAASAITAVLTHRTAAEVTGRGTGVDDNIFTRKQSVVQQVVDNFEVENGNKNALALLQSAGGLEIAAIAGMILGAARHGTPVIIDGFISTAAAAIVFSLVPSIRDYLFAGHQSQEPGHRFLLEYLGLKPLLQLDMRLGEGTGAVLAMPVIESAVALYCEMATFASAGVSGAGA
ncbi:nicotinate-nucleotide--dimethylbenzimidazole phosphoribosyltransferase [Silvibacterium acidisoli]|uniref:nicotinate-nucleotide--dimethylbenzimidazole phosphoribosyltransferase n=1 Tax=Acidobacteriaceae bacterium ZG23-2 TaxID=2883246 RepID=UPI00406D23C3